MANTLPTSSSTLIYHVDLNNELRPTSPEECFASVTTASLGNQGKRQVALFVKSGLSPKSVDEREGFRCER